MSPTWEIMVALCIEDLSHAYQERRALDGVTFEIQRGEIFGVLGPNGGGKTTLFRVLSTLLPIQSGRVTVLGFDAATNSAEVRRRIGVTFQAPSLDRRLTVRENLVHQGHLYGLSGRMLAARIEDRLARLGLSDRQHALVNSLSGGLQRRAEIAKGMLHDPELLLLDEPSTGLDPGARHDLWRYLLQLRGESGTTIVVTTHLMEEAEKCDRLGLLDHGRLVAIGTPTELRAEIGGDCLTILAEEPARLSQRIAERFGIEPKLFGQSLRIEQARGHELLRDLVEAFPNEITSVSLGKPSLEDVFIAKTGHRFWEEDNAGGK
ncbi:MAG: ATP-binding cassette domain-containing protein [Planctomycetaceae bacterium]